MCRFSGWPAVVVGFVTVLTIGGCSSVKYNWGWYEVLPTTTQGSVNLMFLLEGVWMTVGLAAVSIVLSVSAGLLVALPGLAKNRL